MSVTEAHEAIIEWSQFLSKHKRESAIPTQCTYIVSGLWNCVAALNRSHQCILENHYPAYSRLANSYIANEAPLKDNHLAPQCKILDSDEWMRYREDPTSQNLDRLQKSGNQN